MSITSYAQNFEDVILWRVLKHVTNGCYVDIGAFHPVEDSISKAFYEQGWRGIHVEPVKKYAQLIRDDRPDEIVIEAAVSEEPGEITFYEIPNTGLSTVNRGIALEHHEKQGFEIIETKVSAVTLDSVLQLVSSNDIHWMKIDVEGFEREVLSGWLDPGHRPWVIVIESTLPNTQVDTYDIWESLILDKGYRLVYQDGLNRFYLHEAHKDLADKFIYPPNIFDEFQLSNTSAYTRALVQHYQSEIQQLKNALEEAESQHRVIENAVSEALLKVTELEAVLKSEVNILRNLAMQSAEITTAQGTASREALDCKIAHLQRWLQDQLEDFERRQSRWSEIIQDRITRNGQNLLDQALVHSDKLIELFKQIDLISSELADVRKENSVQSQLVKEAMESAVIQVRQMFKEQMEILLKYTNDLQDNLYAEQQARKVAECELKEKIEQMDVVLEEKR